MDWKPPRCHRKLSFCHHRSDVFVPDSSRIGSATSPFFWCVPVRPERTSTLLWWWVTGRFFLNGLLQCTAPNTFWDCIFGLSFWGVNIFSVYGTWGLETILRRSSFMSSPSFSLILTSKSGENTEFFEEMTRKGSRNGLGTLDRVNFTHGIRRKSRIFKTPNHFGEAAPEAWANGGAMVFCGFSQIDGVKRKTQKHHHRWGGDPSFFVCHLEMDPTACHVRLRWKASKTRLVVNGSQEFRSLGRYDKHRKPRTWSRGYCW